MSWLVNFFTSSIGKKLLMSLSGLFFSSFLAIHIIGNLLIFFGPQSFNNYVRIMSESRWIIGMEVFMILCFLVHISLASILTVQNRMARPQRYAMDVSAGKRTLMSSNMFVTGSLILTYVIFHLISFKFGPWSNNPADGSLSMYELVKLRFENIYYFAPYTAALVVLGFHLNHGVQSAFQTLGVSHAKYTPLIKSGATLYSIITPLLFASFPLYFFISQFYTGG